MGILTNKDGNSLVPAAQANDYPGSNCRYISGGGQCSPTEFDNGACNPAAGQICVCGELCGNDDPACTVGQWRYGIAHATDWHTVPPGRSESYMNACGNVTGTNQNADEYCATHPGESFTFQNCNNPGKCPGSPNGTIRAVVRCDGVLMNEGFRFELSRGGNGIETRDGPETTFTTPDTGNYEVGLIDEANFNRIKAERFPNIAYGQGFSYVKTVGNGQTAEFNFINCNSAPPPTATPTPTPPVNQGSISVNAYCLNTNNQRVAFTEDFNLRVAVLNDPNNPGSGISAQTMTRSRTNISFGNLQNNRDYGINVESLTNTALTIVDTDCTLLGGQSNGGAIRTGGSCSINLGRCGGNITTTPTPTPTTTPTPPPGSNQINVNAVCVDGTQEGNLNIPFTSSRGNGDGNTPETITYQGTGNTDVTIGNIPQALRDRYPNISFRGSVINNQNFQNATQRTVAASQTVTYQYQGCTRPEKQPLVRIEKRLVSPNPQQLVTGQTRVIFDIVVTNISPDRTDITDFNLRDVYDPLYLQFVRSTHNGTEIKPRECPATGACTNPGTLNWEKLPENNGVLAYNETYVMRVEFIALQTTRGVENTRANDNCGVVTTIEYIDENNQDAQESVNLEHCAPFDITDVPATVTVQVDKRAITQSVRHGSGNLAQFQATITNNTNAPYTRIDFVDTFTILPDTNGDGIGEPTTSQYLEFSHIILKKYDRNGNLVKTHEPTNLGASGSIISIRNIELIEGFGNLNPGEKITFDIFFRPKAPTPNRACDQVSAQVWNGNNHGNGYSPVVCIEITSPLPPKTGASFTLNFIVPTLTLVASLATRKYLLAA